MFNITQIQNCFEGLVAFRKSSDPSYPELIPSISTPITGRYISHPLCTIENLYNAGPEFAGFTNTQTELKAKFNEWLTDLYKDSCTDLVAKLLEMKKINDAAKSLIQNQQLYTGFGFVGDKVIKHSRFVGFQIDTRKMNNIMVILSQIGFQVDEAQTVKFYLYHTSQQESVKEIDVVVSRANSFTWQDTLSQVLLSYMSGQESSQGFYIFGYYEDDLQGQAIKMDKTLQIIFVVPENDLQGQAIKMDKTLQIIFGYYEDDLQGQAIKMDKTLQNQPCLSCSNADLVAFNSWSKYVGIRAIEVPESSLDPDKGIFDVSKISYANNTNFGINLSITTVCDLTSFFCVNRLAFTDALAKQITLNAINKIAYSTRMNTISDKTKGLAMADLDVESKSSFINFEYKKALEALNVDFSGFDENCLPCLRNSGIQYGVI